MKCDFEGYVTKNDIRCMDGRIIRKDAFKDNDKTTVPLVWQHRHDSPDNVLGHVQLENRNNGVYGYGVFNNTEMGQKAKELVNNRDIRNLSIYANNLIEKNKNVMHGSIKEVSLVLAGANPGAVINSISVMHADGDIDYLDDEAEIFTDEEILRHADDKKEDEEQNIEDTKETNDDEEDDEEEDEDNEDWGDEEFDDSSEQTKIQNEGPKMTNKTVGEIMDSMNPKQTKIAEYVISAMLNGTGSFDYEKTVQHINKLAGDVDLENVFTDEQKDALYYLVSEAINEKNIKHSDEGGTDFMKFNVFENQEETTNTLSHAEMVDIISDAKRNGSLKDAFLAHAGENYGFGPYSDDREDGYDGIDVLFPDARLVDKKIELLRNNPTDWVAKVMGGVNKSPFSRIKMIYADITADEARAKGYVTGAKKVSEVISLLHRTTAPTTIYKLQKLDRDDVVDITDWDIVAWIKAEMRIMLEEEIARQILVGDFRAAGDRDRIDPNCVRPIINDTDADLYAVRHSYTVSNTENEHEKFIDECCLAQIGYEGTGSPSLITSPEYVMHMLLVKDTLGNRIYKTRNELASACGVKEIIECPFLKNRTRTEDNETINSLEFKDADGNTCLAKGLIVNLSDYTVGADKGGAINMFDDFDIDFNQLKYLIETRISGSLTKPKSAVVIGVQQ